jgi:hypothetical protein
MIIGPGCDAALLLRSFLYFQPVSRASILSVLKCKLQAKQVPHLPRPRWGISFCAKRKTRRPSFGALASSQWRLEGGVSKSTQDRPGSQGAGGRTGVAAQFVHWR